MKIWLDRVLQSYSSYYTYRNYAGDENAEAILLLATATVILPRPVHRLCSVFRMTETKF